MGDKDEAHVWLLGIGVCLLAFAFCPHTPETPKLSMDGKPAESLGATSAES